ncbi:hypothetical protein OAS44_01845 [Flavobacteriaceae bacterium]|nr:hypothetical protein [Flavobacteriaceae bacterium]
MKIDKTTYKDKEENNIGMTADHTSQPDKVLFFADPHFLFFKESTHIAHIGKSHKPTRKPKLAKECNFANPELKNYE